MILKINMKLFNKIFFIAFMLGVFVIGNSIGGGGIPPFAFAADFTFTHNLALGMREDDVAILQQFLIAGGFLKISMPTNYFGPLTKNALSAWQVSVGIRPSVGFFGPISRARINTSAQQTPINVVQLRDTIGTTTIAVATTSMAITNNQNGSPIRLKIPKINVDASFQYNSLKSDGTMEIPDNVVDVGWFTGSPRPGERGSAVITGHVAQIRGGVLIKPGVFSNLNELRAGDRLYIINDKGETITFIVRESRNYDPLADATDVFISKDGGTHLNIITCEGVWNQSQLSYSQRLVIFTDILE